MPKNNSRTLSIVATHVALISTTGGSFSLPAIHNVSDDNIAMEYLRKLHDYRKQHGLSFRQVAKIIHCAPSTICSYENFGSIPDVNSYNALADFFKWPRYSPQHNSVPTLQESKKHRAYSIPENLLEDLRDIASVKGCSISEIITSVLTDYTAKHKGSLLAIRELRNS